MAGRRFGDGCWEIDTKAFSCTRAFDLTSLVENQTISFARKLYPPLPFKCFQVYKMIPDGFIICGRFVLPKEPTTNFRVLSFWNGVFDVSLFKTIKSDYDAINFSKRIVEVSFGGASRELHLLA